MQYLMWNESDCKTEYRQLFQAWNPETLWVSGGVSISEIERAERRLGMAFPQSFRIFLSEYGAVRLNHTHLFGLGVDDLRLNLVSRNLLEWPRPPMNLLFVAETIVGNRFYLTTAPAGAEEDSPVMVDLNERGLRKYSASYLEFIQELCKGVLPVENRLQKFS